MEEKKEQNVYLYSRSRLELSGILDVCEFCESTVELALNDGFLAVDGDELKIDYFSSDTGKVMIHGNIVGIVYYSKSPSCKKNKKKKL